MPSGDYEMMRQAAERERTLEYRSSQVAFTSELVQQIEDLARKNLELEGRVSQLEEELKLRVDYAKEVRELQYKLNCIESQKRIDKLAENRNVWSSKEAAEAGTENWIE